MNTTRTPREIPVARPARALALAALTLLLQGCPPPEFGPPPPVPVIVEGFDLFMDGAPVSSGTVIEGQYGKRGIVLENAQSVDAATYADLTAESAPNVLVTTDPSPRLGTIRVRFVRPSDGESQGETATVGATFVDVDDAAENARLEAYDDTDTLLDAAAVPVGGDGARQYVEVEAADIAYVLCVLAEAGDGAALDDLTYEAVTQEIFIVQGYPGEQSERKLVELYLSSTDAGKEGDTYYLSEPNAKRYLSVEVGSSKAELDYALQRPGSYVGFTGHSNFGLGIVFAELPDHSHIEWVTSIADFVNISSDLVGISYSYLVHTQAYPNLWIPEEEIAVYPENYCTPIGVQRFPNNDGVGVCETFGEVQGTGYDRYHYNYQGYLGDPTRLVVEGGNDDLVDPLRYHLLYYRSCNSGTYYSESFDRGVFFYTTADSIVGAQDVLVKGIHLGFDWDELKTHMNMRQNNNDYYDFTQWAPYDRCDPACE